MNDNGFRVANLRFHMSKPDTLVVFGTFADDNPEGRTIQCCMDQAPLVVEQQINSGVQVRKKYLSLRQNINEEHILILTLPDGWKNKKRFSIREQLNGKNTDVFSLSVNQLKTIQRELPASIEMGVRKDGNIHLTGWAIAGQESSVSIVADGKVVSHTQNAVDDTGDFSYFWKYRKDVLEAFPEVDGELEAGCEISFSDKGYRKLIVTFEAEGRRKKIVIPTSKLTGTALDLTELSLPQKAWGYFKKYGLKKTMQKTMDRLQGKRSGGDYDTFREKYEPKQEELQRQREDVFAIQPCFSIVIPMFRTDKTFLKELLESIQAQTYTNWQLCLADGSGKEDALADYLKNWLDKDQRIRYKLLDENKGIAGNTNAALQMATGDYIVLCDHDDLLAPNALYECVKVINEKPEVDVIYSDEDKIDMKGKTYFEPHFKSDYNIDLLCTMNYICHLFVFSKEILARVGGFESCYDGAQDHDFILRCVENATQIHHIPKVLYHWRSHMNSTSENPESKLYAFENGCKAVEAHYKRLGIPATVEQGPFYGMYRTIYHWEEQPLLSIIIPNKDHVEDLKKCINSIDERSVYRNYEFVIIENNSTEDETFAYYRELQERENVTVIYYEGEFNYSRINNVGAKAAKGDYFLLLNNDTEMINPSALKDMLDICMRDDVGIVGARLFYEDNTIQHAGVIIGFGGMAGHAFIGQDREDNGYFSRIMSTQDLSAVTAACLMVKKDVYFKVEGLSEEFRVAFNDIDFCLKVRKAGYLVVYDPYATFYHYESKSRGLEDSLDKITRFNQEVDLLVSRWNDIMTNGDPYYNPNLTLDKADFSLKE